MTLRSLPASTGLADIEALLVRLPFHCRVHFALEALAQEKALSELKRKRDQAHLLATLREKRNQEAEAQEDDVAELIDKNLRQDTRMVKLALSVVLSVDAGVENAQALLERQTQEVFRVASSQMHGTQVMVDEMCQADEFLATLPAYAHHGRRWRQCTSENGAHLMPVWQPWPGDPRPTVLVQNGRGNLIGLDPFDESLDNPNAFMAGASGAGKSSTTNYLLLNALASGAKALIGSEATSQLVAGGPRTDLPAARTV